MRISTRKMLAPFDPEQPDKVIKGFLYPNIDSESTGSFEQIGTGKKWSAGIVVLVGREITKEDIFAKIVDSGRQASVINVLLESLDVYLQQINEHRIGDIVGLRSSTNGFELIKLEKPPRSISKLPR
jgi:hypothetical protein